MAEPIAVVEEHDTTRDAEMYAFAVGVVEGILARLEQQHTASDRRACGGGWVAELERSRATHMRRAIELVVIEARQRGLAVWSAVL